MMNRLWSFPLLVAALALAAAAGAQETPAPAAEPAAEPKVEAPAVAEPAPETPAAAEPVVAEPKVETPAPVEPKAPTPKPAPKAEPAHIQAPRVEAPKVEPKPRAPEPKAEAPAKAETTMAVGERAKAELTFLQNAFKTAAGETLTCLPEQVDAYLTLYRELDGADMAQYLKFEVHEKQGDLLAASVDLLKLLYEYPDTKLSFNAKKKLMEIVDKKIRKQKPAVTEVSKGPGAGLDRPGRLIALLRALASLKETAIYEPTVAEFNEFFRRYPDHPSVGEMIYLLAQVYAQNGKQETAILLNEKVLAVYSKDGPLGAKAETAIADIYAGALRNYDKAVESYQAVTDKFGSFPEAGDAYVKMARILDENLKQPALAVDRLEKIVSLYPNTDAAFAAFREQSRIQRDRNKDFGKAVEALTKLADMFPGDRAVAALKDAADLAGGSLKDYTLQAKLLERVAADFPQDKSAAQCLWDAAQLYERQLTNPGAAKGVYEKLVADYAKDSLAKKASKRIEALNK
ncbi:MAG: tetratricopeptide repeat protein [Elusimicrobiota bacterium]|jgi:tetratricopeptide (TPR) repeat protein